MNDSEEIIPVKAGLYCRNFFFSRKISFLSFFLAKNVLTMLLTLWFGIGQTQD